MHIYHARTCTQTCMRVCRKKGGKKADRWNRAWQKSLDRNSIARMELRCKCYDTEERSEGKLERRRRNKKIRAKERASGGGVRESERLDCWDAAKPRG